MLAIRSEPGSANGHLLTSFLQRKRSILKIGLWIFGKEFPELAAKTIESFA